MWNSLLSVFLKLTLRVRFFWKVFWFRGMDIKLFQYDQEPWASLVAQLVKNPPAMWETWVWSLGWEDPLEKGKATHSGILAWRIPWTSPWDHKESDMTEQLSLHFHFQEPWKRFIKEFMAELKAIWTGLCSRICESVGLAVFCFPLGKCCWAPLIHPLPQHLVTRG